MGYFNALFGLRVILSLHFTVFIDFEEYWKQPSFLHNAFAPLAISQNGDGQESCQSINGKTKSFILDQKNCLNSLLALCNSLPRVKLHL